MSLFHRMVLGFAVSAALAGPAAAGQVCYFGECGPAPDATPTTTPVLQPADPPSPAQPSGKTRGSGPTGSEPSTAITQVVATYGSWDVVLSSGQRVAVDKFDDGSRVTFGKIDGAFVLLLDDPTWKLPDGKEFDVDATIDGDRFTGTAKVVNGHTLVIGDISVKFLAAMRNGEKIKIEVANSTWEINLVNAAEALDAVAGRAGDRTTS